MRRILICLVPWMATAVSATADDPPELAYSHSVVVTRDLERRGDGLLAAIPVLKKLGWTSEYDGDQVRIMAEGRELRLSVTQSNGRPMVDLSEAWVQLGAHAEWSETGVLNVLGQVRSLVIQDSELAIDSTLAAKGRVFRLSNPDRIVVDLTGAKLSLPADFRFPAGVRASQYQGNVVRIVIDGSLAPAAQLGDFPPTRFARIRLTPSAASSEFTEPGMDPASDPNVPLPILTRPDEVLANPLPVLSNVRIEHSNFEESRVSITLSASPAVRPIAVYRTPSEIEVSIPGATIAPDLTLPSAEAGSLVDSIEVLAAGESADSTRLLIRLRDPAAYELGFAGNIVTLRLERPRLAGGSLKGRLIVVDAGHGGTDTGAAHSKVREKDLTLKIAKALAKALTSAGASVILTRTDDTLIPLKERPAIANRANADLFVSVHINSNKLANSRSGSISFYHANQAVPRLLATCIQAELAKGTGIPGIGVWSDTRIYRTGFAVLRYARMPAVLLELGFINHSSDRSKMASDEFGAKVAASTVKGIKVFLGDGK
ncbi:MAG: hypothetical protein HONBIEJF_00591 [Fimbriimonadaceae bacterium]|nr:hypothetical protein [Fimbriimonadaceae bacterium]